jgi:uncharacterized lipoprotein YmbA
MTSPKPARSAALLVALVLAVAACSLNPRQDPSEFYVLTSAAGEAAGPSASTGSDLVIGLGPVSFPAYLDRRQMVTRLSDNQVSLSEYERWAEPLAVNFARALAANLQLATGARNVVVYPWPGGTGPQFAVVITVSRFERDASGAAELRCRWRVVDAEGTVVSAREATYRQPAAAASTDASVAALSRTIEDLSGDIAAVIRQQLGG